MDILTKQQMTEEDIKLNFITPALLNKGWQNKITMETSVKLTDGKVNLKGNLTFREPAKKADYLLYISANNPIAVVEAKDNNHSISYGLQQAMTYAQMLDLPFAYSSNGDGFAEHDFLTGTEREFGMGEFPTEAELLARLNQEASITPAQEAIRSQPYYSRPEHLSATLLSAHCHQPHLGCDCQRTAALAAGNGYRHRQDLYCLPDRIPPLAERDEAEDPVSGGPEYSGGSVHSAGFRTAGQGHP